MRVPGSDGSRRRRWAIWLWGIGWAAVALGCETKLEILSAELDAGGADTDAGHAADGGCACGALEICRDDGSCRGLPMGTTIAAGDGHSCRVRDGELWCWGDNRAGQLGLGSGPSEPKLRPQQVAAGADVEWVRVAAGAQHTCALRNPGVLACWGDDSHKQLGNSQGVRSRDQQRFWARDLVQLDCGGNNCCAVRREGELYCWGDNAQGSVGVDSSEPFVSEPARVGADGQTFLRVSVGTAHSCAIASDRTLWCWGNNDRRQLGVEEPTDYAPAPVKISEDADWSWIAAGGSHTCGIRDDNALFCWGDNRDGQLGIPRVGPDGEPLEQALPMTVMTTRGWARVEAGARHTCAIRIRGAVELLCWGWGEDGRLGRKVEEPLDVPSVVMTDTQWGELALGADHSCGLDLTEPVAKMFCWGSNATGQLGLDDTLTRDSPDNEVAFP